jgi:hypothetical protein
MSKSKGALMFHFIRGTETINNNNQQGQPPGQVA